MQGDEDRLDTPPVQGGQQLRTKVQSRGWGSHCAKVAGVDRLVPFTVYGLTTQRTLDVGRQRHLAEPFEEHVQVFLREKPQHPAPFAGRTEPRSPQFGSEPQAGASADVLSSFTQYLPGFSLSSQTAQE